MSFLKRCVKEVVASPLGWATVGRALRAPGAVVLMYHRVGDGGGIFPALDPLLFERQMVWLRRNCSVLDPGLLEEAVTSPGSRVPVLVTFDDGYRDYHDVAYPILRRLGIPAVVFLATALMDEGGLLWTDTVDLAFARSRRVRVKLPWVDHLEELGNGGARAGAARSAKGHLKRLPDEERRRLVPLLLSALGVDATDLDVARQMLSWDEVRATQDLTTYGGHSHTHPIMTRLDDGALQEEIRACRERLVRETGREPRLFAYPNGDCSPAVKEAVAAGGFDVGFSTVMGVNGPATDWMAVRRIPGDGTPAEFAWLLTGRVRG